MFDSFEEELLELLSKKFKNTDIIASSSIASDTYEEHMFHEAILRGFLTEVKRSNGVIGEASQDYILIPKGKMAVSSFLSSRSDKNNRSD